MPLFTFYIKCREEAIVSKLAEGRQVCIYPSCIFHASNLRSKCGTLILFTSLVYKCNFTWKCLALVWKKNHNLLEICQGSFMTKILLQGTYCYRSTTSRHEMVIEFNNASRVPLNCMVMDPNRSFSWRQPAY